jgi:hypothetical protein
MKGVFPWLVRLARRAGTRGFCTALAALVSPVQNIFPPSHIFFSLFVPIAQQPGGQSCRVACILKCVSAYILEYSNCKRGLAAFPPSPFVYKSDIHA